MMLRNGLPAREYRVHRPRYRLSIQVVSKGKAPPQGEPAYNIVRPVPISVFVIQAFHIGLADELGSRALDSSIQRVTVKSSTGILFTLAASISVHVKLAMVVDRVIQ